MPNTTAETSPRNKSWLVAIGIAATGIATSIYSIKHHLELRIHGHTEASCNINSAINCDAVASSKYSEFLDIPLGVWGLGYFLAMIVLAATVYLQHKSKKDHEPAWFLLSAIGVLTSLALAGISLGVLGTVCIVCVIIYTLTLAQAGVAWKIWKDSQGKLAFNPKSIVSGLSTAAVVLALAVAGFTFLKPAKQLPPELQDTPGKVDGPKVLSNLSPTAVDIPINKNAYSGFGEDFRKGSDNAKIVIVEFADYMCPACGQTAPVLEDLTRQLGSRALLVFKNFPLSNQCNSGMQQDMHPYSCDIAKLARCAGNKGKFWDYHLLAMSEQSRASKEKLKEWGKQTGLSDQEMSECLASKDILEKIKDDVRLADKIGVNSTPTIFINGRKYFGERTASALRATIESM
jgi:protein-disulfide isomerase